MNTVKLNNGVEMPQMGYGVYQVSPAECERCVTDALSVGYRMIDTAQAYHNEEGVGNAVRRSGINRKEIFLVSKVWISNYGYEKAKASIDESLSKLQTDYIDLMLLHQPFCDRYGAYRALEEAYKEGRWKRTSSTNKSSRSKSWRSSVRASCPGDRLPRGATASSRTRFLPKSAASTAKAWRRSPCVGSSSAVSSSSPNRPTSNGCSRTSTSSTSRSPTRIWPPSPRSTRVKAFSSTTTMRKPPVCSWGGGNCKQRLKRIRNYKLSS